MQIKFLDVNEVGLDEAGRGPLLGRVYASAVIWNQQECNLINDSKKLSKKKRQLALEWINKNNILYGKACIEKALLFLFTTTSLKNETLFHFLMVLVMLIQKK
jgi:ribonuclease HII